jgi:hypothetical protein
MAVSLSLRREGFERKLKKPMLVVHVCGTGKDGGLRTMLVLSGVTTENELLGPNNSIIPDYYTDALPDLLTAKP